MKMLVVRVSTAPVIIPLQKRNYIMPVVTLNKH